MRLNRIYVIAVLMWGLASSCISEDYSDCYNRYIVDLSYLGDGTMDIFAEKIDRVQMYVFDQGNTCVHQGLLTEDEVNRQSTMLPPLDEGQYRIVFLGNTYSTGVRDMSTRSGLEGMCFGAEAYWNGKEVSGNDPLYWAAADQKIEPFDPERQITRNSARFLASHYDVSVEVEGAPSDIRIVLTGVSPYTDFENTATLSHKTDYVLNTVHDGVSKAKAECCIMRHQNHEDVCLKVMSFDGTELASVNFDDFIKENSRYIDCSKQEVHIPFKVEFMSAKVEISIPEWWVMHVHPDFGS